jgi:CRISPR/Cas system Type II protein with McrA/HNH and RuvC-like nuclease domain
VGKISTSILIISVILLALIVYGEMQLRISSYRSDARIHITSLEADVRSSNSELTLLFSELELSKVAPDHIQHYITITEKYKLHTNEFKKVLPDMLSSGSITSSRNEQLNSLIDTANDLFSDYKDVAKVILSCSFEYNKEDIKLAKKKVEDLTCRSESFRGLCISIIHEMKR